MNKIINTYRIIIAFIVLNLSVALAVDVYNNTQNTWQDTEDFMNNSITNSQSMQEAELFASSPRDDIQISEASLFIKIWRLMGTIGYFIITAINPLSIPYWNFTNIVERTGALLLGLIRSFLLMIIGMEIWSYFINKKQP